MYVSTASVIPKPPSCLPPRHDDANNNGSADQLSLGFDLGPHRLSAPKSISKRRPRRVTTYEPLQRSLLSHEITAEEAQEWISTHWEDALLTFRYGAAMSPQQLGEELSWLLDSNDNGPFSSTIGFRLRGFSDLRANDLKLDIVKEVKLLVGSAALHTALVWASRFRPWLLDLRFFGEALDLCQPTEADE